MPKLKDTPISERPREKFLAHGPDKLSKSELLAILLGSGIKGKNVKEVSDQIIKKFGKNFLKTKIEELEKIPGIGKAKALQISAAFSLVERFLKEQTPKLKKQIKKDLQKSLFDKNEPQNKTKEEKKDSGIRFIDLFAGIGGFHQSFHNEGAECVFASEWDEHARETYSHNFYKINPEFFKKGNFVGDITKIKPETIPDFEILTAGFPCQPFSQAGFKKGFSETRGTLFFDIVNIIKIKKPKAFFLENVRHLLKHDDGKTFDIIKKMIEDELGYSFYYKIMKASDYGVPQYRPRLFMVGFRNKKIKFKFPDSLPLKKTMSDIFGGVCERDVGFTLRVGGRGTKISDRRNWDSYMVDGKVRKLTSKEGLKMQGFPDNFEFPVSENQAMKQLGNSVAIPAIQTTAREIIKTLKKYEKE